jgi:serine/threonine protein phosphatase PrpC
MLELTSRQSFVLLAGGLIVFFFIVFLWSWSRRRALGVRPEASRPARRDERREPARVSAPAPPPPSSAKPKPKPAEPELPRIGYEEDQDLDPTFVGKSAARTSLSPPTQKIIYDEDAANEEPTQSRELILVTAIAQTDKGVRRKNNEDAVLAMQKHCLFVVADGMGGYRGGEIASRIAVRAIEEAFETSTFPGPPHDTIPRRASELARAIQMANEAILARAEHDKQLEGMGTTVCAARFSPNKQRLYVGHVGDSRIYRMRAGKLRQMTSDHTMKDLGVTGAGAAHLSRAVVLLGATSPDAAVDMLIRAANESGGKDNISVIVVRVEMPTRPRVAA